MTQRIVQILSASLFIAVLLWGLWTLLYYLGVPVHGSVLLSESTLNSLTELCTPTAFLCRGVYLFFPFLTHTLSRVPFLAWYAVLCALCYGISLGIHYLRTRTVEVAWTMTPWKIVLLFTSMLWLLFTCLSFSSNGTMSLRSIIEPRPEVYEGAGEEALVSLQENYDIMKSRGCLTRIGVFGGVAEASEINVRCLQQSFFTRVFPPLVFLLFFAFELLVAGRFALRRVLRIPLAEGLMEAVLSLGFGAGVWIVLLWFGAAIGIYQAWFGWGLALLIPVAAFRDAQYWIDRFLSASWGVQAKWYGPHMLLVWFLLSYLALNYLNVVRPFPIGWDDLGSYLNRPRLLVSYGEFVHSLPSFQWEYLTSLGFLLFGFESIFGATASMMINWFAGLLAILIILLFGRTFIGHGKGILAATLYYTLPLVGHFSFADMKIDNAVFSMGAFATFCLFFALFTEHERPATLRRWVLIAGIFAGLAFSMKITAIMVFMALAAVIAGAALHWLAFPAAFLLVCALYIQEGGLNIPKIFAKLNYGTDVAAPLAVFLLFLACGVALLAAALWIRKDRIVSFAIVASMFVGGFAIAVFPWVEHNNILQGFIIPHMRLTTPNTFTPQIDIFGDSPGARFALGPDLVVDRSLCKATAGTEELDRYWGNRIGWGHYLTLPWRSVMNIDHAGYYVTTQPALLLFPLLLLLPFFWRKQGRWLRWLWLSTLFLLLQWMFLANGVPWYGIGVFFGLVLCLEALVSRAPDALNRSLAASFMTVGILICLGMRLWQYESQRNLFEYAVGKVSAETLRERTIPYYDDITDIVTTRHETMPDRPMLYRIGTFIPYFIPKNLEVIGIADHQLDTFHCLYQEKDKIKTVQRLKALGFNSIILDLNTATIERDPNGSLHQKVQALTDFLNSPEAGLQLVFYDADAGIAFLLIP